VLGCRAGAADWCRRAQKNGSLFISTTACPVASGPRAFVAPIPSAHVAHAPCFAWLSEKGKCLGFGLPALYAALGAMKSTRSRITITIENVVEADAQRLLSAQMPSYFERIEALGFECNWIGLALVPNEHCSGYQARLSVKNSNAKAYNAKAKLAKKFPEFKGELQFKVDFVHGDSTLAAHVLSGVPTGQRLLQGVTEAELSAMVIASKTKGSAKPLQLPAPASLFTEPVHDAHPHLWTKQDPFEIGVASIASDADPAFASATEAINPCLPADPAGAGESGLQAAPMVVITGDGPPVASPAKLLAEQLDGMCLGGAGRIPVYPAELEIENMDEYSKFQAWCAKEHLGFQAWPPQPPKPQDIEHDIEEDQNDPFHGITTPAIPLEATMRRPGIFRCFQSETSSMHLLTETGSKAQHKAVHRAVMATVAEN
jgi:hypothetical protein